jgi:hypothetical protein
MAETLQLTHTVGRAGWDIAHAGGGGEFALAAIGHCFAQRRLLFNLPLLWRLRKLWQGGIAAIDPRALRLAVCVDERVRVSGARLDVAIEPPAAAPSERTDAAPRSARARKSGGAAVQIALPLAVVRERDARLPAASAGLAWRVQALSADGVTGFRKLARALSQVPRGSTVRLTVSARDSRAPATLRRAFPLRVDLLLAADDDYLTLIPARELSLEPG